MGYIETNELSFALPGGRVLFEGVSFRVRNRRHVVLVGANGSGKTTMLKILSGAERPTSGVVRVDGSLLVMHQFIGTLGRHLTVGDFLLGLASPEVRAAAADLRKCEQELSAGGDVHERYAAALARWGEAGGYEAEVLWDTCTTVAMKLPLEEAGPRSIHTLSGGEQKRLALEALFRSDAAVLLLDEPDNFLDIAGKRWLEEKLNASKKTILFVSHDRALLANTADAVVTIEARGAWTHPETFATYNEARLARNERIEEERKRYREKHDRLIAQMKEFKRRAAMSDVFASRAKAAVTRLQRFERTVAQPERPAEQNIKMGLGGGRTGKLALKVMELGFPGLVEPFTAELYFGEKVGVVGPNGTGKSHFLRLLAGEDISHLGECRLGARVQPSLFSQLHDRPDIEDIDIVDVLAKRGLELGRSMPALKRFELGAAARVPFSLLSGGQQARFQLLLMEIENPTMLLLDEPTDNLDVESAEALEEGLMAYEGTVVAVTHDRWFMLLMDRFLVFNADGTVTESAESPYELSPAEPNP